MRTYAGPTRRQMVARRLLRRGYSFTDGAWTRSGRVDAGLFFIAFQRDPRTAFVRIQHNLAGLSGDAMNEYIQHISSSLFACPGGVARGGLVGRQALRLSPGAGRGGDAHRGGPADRLSVARGAIVCGTVGCPGAGGQPR